MQPTDTPEESDVLGFAEAAALVGCSKEWLYALIEKGRFPPPRRLMRQPYYLRRTVLDWKATNPAIRNRRKRTPKAPA